MISQESDAMTQKTEQQIVMKSAQEKLMLKKLCESKDNGISFIKLVTI